VDWAFIIVFAIMLAVIPAFLIGAVTTAIADEGPGICGGLIAFVIVGLGFGAGLHGCESDKLEQREQHLQTIQQRNDELQLNPLRLTADNEQRYLSLGAGWMCGQSDDNRCVLLAVRESGRELQLAIPMNKVQVETVESATRVVARPTYRLPKKVPPDDAGTEWNMRHALERLVVQCPPGACELTL